MAGNLGQRVRGRRVSGLAAAVGVAGLVLAACSSSSSTSAGTPAPTSKASVATVKVATTGYGRILETPTGQVVYALTADTPSKAACTGSCLGLWPPVTSPGAPVAGSGVSQSLLGTYNLSTGAHQLTYAGHQLYLFSGDTAPGDIKGQGLPFPASAASPSGHWYVVSASGSLVTATTPSGATSSGSSSSSSTSTTYGGY